MMSFLRLLRFRLAVLAAAGAAGLVVSAVTAAPASAPGQPAQNAYTIYTPDGRRTLPVRPSGNTELVSIDQLTGPFGLTVTEDNVLRGLVITSRGRASSRSPASRSSRPAAKSSS